MKVIYGLHHLKRRPKRSVVTIGVFDGVHIGHREIITRVVSSARASGLASAVITFDPHPAKVLEPRAGTPSLISLEHRIRLIGSLGVDTLLVVKFTRPFSRMPAERFIRGILVGKLRAALVYVGEDFYFGPGAAAGAGILRKASRQYGFKVKVINPVRSGGRAVSSSLIRKLITGGTLAEAAKLLGRPVSVFGTVVRGSRIARGLGCPTANINPHHEVMPPKGVYAVKARFNGRTFAGILNIGFRPTFYGSRDEEPTIEAHFFGFKGNLYNKDIEVYFIKKLREERRFGSIEELVARIRKDIKRARSILSA